MTTAGTWSQDDYIAAYQFAARAHLGQTVPGTDISYLMHLSLVSMEIIAALAAEPERNQTLALQCALLHDVLEDTTTTYGELAAAFGTAVADGVRALSKDKGVPKSGQMADSLRRIREHPQEIWMVKLADRITNLQPPPVHWSADKVTHYKAQAVEIHDALCMASAFLSARILAKIAVYGNPALTPTSSEAAPQR